MSELKFKLDEQELKKELAYLDAEDLLYTMKSNVDFLESHNKNYTKEQYYKICEVQAFIKGHVNLGVVD